MTITIEHPLTTTAPVIDSAEYAWNEFGATGLGAFALDWSDALNAAGRLLIQRHLIDAWRERGYLVRLVDAQTFERTAWGDGPGDVVFHEVWQEAADQIDSDALLDAADLRDEYTAWRAMEGEQ